MHTAQWLVRERKWPSYIGKWCNPEKNYKNVAQQWLSDDCDALLPDLIGKNQFFLIEIFEISIEQKDLPAWEGAELQRKDNVF